MIDCWIDDITVVGGRLLLMNKDFMIELYIVN